MAAFAFELVSPERSLFAGPVEQVIVPGMEGDFAVLRDHMPFITVLRPGVVRVIAEREEHRVYVRGGFADVSAHGLTVMAELAVPIEELGPAGLDEEIRLARKDLDAAGADETRRLAAERLAQLNELKRDLYK